MMINNYVLEQNKYLVSY